VRKLIFLILLVPFFATHAQTDSTNQEYNISTPYHSVYNFLYYLQSDSYEPTKSLQSFKQPGMSDEEALEFANKFKQTLDGKGIFVYVDEFPKDPNYVDTLTNKARYVIVTEYPDIYFEKNKAGWVVSRRSLQAIESAHGELFPFGIDWLLKILPKIGTGEYLGLAVWQHVMLLIMILMSFIIHKIFSFIFEKLLLQYLSKKNYNTLATKFVKPVVKPLSIAIVIWLLSIFVPVLQLPIALAKWVVLILRAIFPLFITIVLYRFVNLMSFYFEKLAEKTASSLDDQLVPLIRKTIRAFVVIVGIFWILTNLNVDIIPLLTGLSIGGLAFALAAQDTIKNFFGSLMIFIDKPFQIGDWITSGDIDGTVEEVGFRSTRIRTFRNSVVYVPNGNLADSTIDNHGLRKYRRFFTQLALTYDTPTHLIQVFVDGLKQIVEKHPETRKDYYEVHMNDMADSSLNVMFYIFFEVPTWSDELRARHEVILEIIDLAKELGVNFAFPTQTLHVENLPGQPTLSPEYNSSRDELEAKVKKFMGNSES
jgi:MscS family membrane protein